MPYLTVSKLDRMIHAAMNLRYRRVARIIGDVMREYRSRGLDITEEEVGERIIALDAATSNSGAGAKSA